MYTSTDRLTKVKLKFGYGGIEFVSSFRLKLFQWRARNPMELGIMRDLPNSLYYINYLVFGAFCTRLQK